MRRWHVYMVRCRDGALYTGITTDVPRRLAQHDAGAGRGAKSLRGRGPLRLVLSRPVGSRGLALSVENRIKRLAKRWKEGLLEHPARLEAIVAKAGGRRPRMARAGARRGRGVSGAGAS
jgi:putative endonuclease